MQMSARYRPAKRLFIGFEDKNKPTRGNVDGANY